MVHPWARVRTLTAQSVGIASGGSHDAISATMRSARRALTPRSERPEREALRTHRIEPWGAGSTSITTSSSKGPTENDASAPPGVGT